MAQPQCMLQDMNMNFYCGLLCTDDSQCPSGSNCKRVGKPEVNLCVHSLSFKDWAVGQSSRVRLNVGFPSLAPGTVTGGGSARSFQLAKAYGALQSLKRRYGIADGDINMLVVKEMLASASASASGGAAAAQSGAQYRDFSMGAWKHDLGYAANNLQSGLPGLQRGIHDTVWNLEHVGDYGVATELMRGLVFIGLAYLIGGSLYKNQALGATGIDMIPHSSFWTEYPSLVVDGIRYSMQVVNEFLGAGSMSRGSDGGATGGLIGRGVGERDTFEAMKS